MKHTDYLYSRLKDDTFAIAYLEEALQDDDYRAFLIAFQDLIEARGIKKSDLAKKAGLSRGGLYGVIDEDSSPEFKSIKKLMKAAGFSLSVKRDTPNELQPA